MTVELSPLDLMLDTENPRFVVIGKREQADIRKYLVTYEDVSQLATGINNSGGLLPGERIVVLRENDKYIVVEGNRRTCSLQMLLSRDLIPDGFGHKIPATSDEIKDRCTTIEVDVLPNRDAALELMTKRHIEGVREWKPIAKKQFFVANYKAGQSVQNLSKITGIKEAEIKGDIRDYKFFLTAYNEYRQSHADFDLEIFNLKIDPFLRIFKAKIDFPSGNRVRPVDVLKIYYDEDNNTKSQLDADLFNEIVQLVFCETTVTEKINTRNIMTDVNGMIPLLERANEPQQANIEEGLPKSTRPHESKNIAEDEGNDISGSGGEVPPSNNVNLVGDVANISSNVDQSGGPLPGGPSPRVFFETVSWDGKLDPSELLHQGLIPALDELYRFSRASLGKQKVYQVFPIATGMILRTVYEQTLQLRLKQVNLWGDYCRTLSHTAFPTLSGMENFIKLGVNRTVVLPTRDMRDAFDRVITGSHRNFLNANIHNPGNIRVHSDSLESIACGGLFYLIQSMINLLP